MRIRNQDYPIQWLNENMMGPNAIRLLDELTQDPNFKLEPGMRVLDLGCGKGLTSIYLAKSFGVTVFATDLWIDPTENFERFQHFDPNLNIIPVYAEATHLPFAKGYFDAVVCIDAFQYFGAKDGFMDAFIAPLVKQNGIIAVSVPGLKHEFEHGIPEALREFWVYNDQGEDVMQFHSPEWWQKLWQKSNQIEFLSAKEMGCFDLAWREWLSCDNAYAKQDIKFIEADGGRYLNFVSLMAKKK